MRTVLRWLLSLVVLAGAVTAQAGTAVAGQDPARDGRDILQRLLAVKGVELVEEKPYEGYRYFVLTYTQPVDHRHPKRGTFEQRFTVLHKDTSRPTVFHTSGYGVSTAPGRSEPTRIIDGNQISLEYRYFTPSRPEPADWSKLTIWQAASDQHRLFQALKPVYGKKWLATGGSKGGMTATYYERFYPRDMDAVVAYVAPNDVVDSEDSAYDRFLEQVGTAECRDALHAVQREALLRRESLSERYRELAEKSGATFTTVGSLDKAFEAVVMDLAWGFWQYADEADCAAVPQARTATDAELFAYVDEISGWSFYTDQGLAPYTPYYYQAGTQLGSPGIAQPHLADLSRYGYQAPREFVPRSIPMRFEKHAMRDVDTWVRHHAQRMMFVYGENDPWSAEPFRLGAGARDSYVLTAPGANHGANVAGLVPDESARATARIQQWAGVAPATAQADPDSAAPLAAYDKTLDSLDEKLLQKYRGGKP
ncbi:S28 family serine protease [Streptomyces sp. NK08203]|uniref:S28 family serine protease n=1 Tax=Streptomyces sp. NK08203 TaxID=2821730 RepID=UPI001C2DC52D|nr:S28 family serine protease [Streptomyces sp. NK08203]